MLKRTPKIREYIERLAKLLAKIKAGRATAKYKT